jgi:DNA-binding transcriptional LysR family regulator
MVAGELARGVLVPVLVDWEPPPLPVQVVHGAGRHVAARVRRFIDHAVTGLRDLDAIGDLQRRAPVA